jgi:4-hydroxy-tetrahydrodipicolinate reductase
VAAVTRSASSVVGADAGVLAGLPPCGVEVAVVGPGCLRNAEVVVDFSLPGALDALWPILGERALVSGTTGLSPATFAQLHAHAARAAVVWSPNFSLGVAVLLDLVKRAAAALPEADLEIVEIHHRRKKDAPSGTAVALAAAASAGRGAEIPAVHGRSGAVGERPANEIGVHAVRGGEVVGDHTVWLLGDGERLSLSHLASSRDTFAAGAVRTARWIASRPPGRYTLPQVLGLVG